ncbi:hypothetical protein Tco_0963322 [Tanacetum coccineum]
MQSTSMMPVPSLMMNLLNQGVEFLNAQATLNTFPMYHLLTKNNPTIPENNITTTDSSLPQGFVSPKEPLEFTNIDDHPTSNEDDHPMSADNPEPTGIQEDVISELISEI